MPATWTLHRRWAIRWRSSGAFDALQDCVGKLAPAASNLVVRHYFERQTLASLAAEEHKQESALRMRLLRIREALRACIESSLAHGGHP